MKILLISGSLRVDSVNTKLLRAFEEELPEKTTVDWADLNIPLFNEDLESNFPPSAEKLRGKILDSDLIIIATPEYNRGITGPLKNALDWASRPNGENAWKGKRVLVVAASSGGISGALALYQVKQSLLHLDAHVFGRPEFLVGNAYEKFDDKGRLIDERTRDFIKVALATITQS